MDLQQPKLIEKAKTIFDFNPVNIANRIKYCTNKELLQNFMETFYALGVYQPKNKLEETHLLELSKVFINEFKSRLKVYQAKRNTQAIEELAKIAQESLKNNPFEIKEKDDSGFVYMVTNTLRLYTLCLKILGKLDVDTEYLKKHYK